jgi:methylmalonyl-CoA/ethylmalonyl-CoA epimerase
MSAARIDHIGVLVADLDRAVRRFQPLFGVAPRIKELPEVGLRVAEFEAQNVTVEFLQYTGAGDAMAKQVMGERPGLNHISLRVSDVAESIAALSRQGFAPMKGFPREGAHGRVAFFEPDAETGLLFEVCEPHPEKA